MVSNTKVIRPNSPPVIPESEAGTLPWHKKNLSVQTLNVIWNTRHLVWCWFLPSVTCSPKYKNLKLWLNNHGCYENLTWSRARVGWGWDSHYLNCLPRCECGPLPPPILMSNRQWCTPIIPQRSMFEMILLHFSIESVTVVLSCSPFMSSHFELPTLKQEVFMLEGSTFHHLYS